MTGTQRLADAFARAAERGRPALTVFLAAGDPDYATTVALARAAVDAGADIIELGSPFSDPLADGPVIQAAYTRALAGGATTAGTLACADEVARATGAPVVLMVALNTVLARGVPEYCAEAAGHGVSGILVPDLPADEADELTAEAGAAGLGTVFLAGPDTGAERLEAIAARSTGFTYLLRRRGVTGAGSGSVDLAGRVAAARAAGTAPVAVGFGITTPADAAEVAGLADGVIVGSVLVDAAFVARSGDRDRGADARIAAAAAAVGTRVRDLAAALAGRPHNHNTAGMGVDA